MKLRIATMVAGHLETPPPEDIIYAPMDISLELTEGLVRRGHEVDFFGPEGSKMKASNVITGGLEPLKSGHNILDSEKFGDSDQHKIYSLWDQYIIAQMFKEAAAGKYDIVHIHPIDRALPIGLSHPEVQTAYTIHDPILKWRAEIFRMFQSPNQHLVSISDAQRKPAPDLNYISTVYNGIRTNEFPFRKDDPDDHFLFVGRLVPEKGVSEAIQAAAKAGVPLKIVGPKGPQKYWEEKIEPFIGKGVEYAGLVPRKKLFEHYSKAKAVLFPIQWEEPFGLVMTEAMACGAPVIAFNKGSVPEVVEDGKTGFIVDNVEEMAEAIENIDKIDRSNCRAHVENKFSMEKMVEGYEETFLKILSNVKANSKIAYVDKK